MNLIQDEPDETNQLVGPTPDAPGAGGVGPEPDTDPDRDVGANGDTGADADCQPDNRKNTMIGPHCQRRDDQGQEKREK